jgi:hypothetical protein
LFIPLIGTRLKWGWRGKNNNWLDEQNNMFFENKAFFVMDVYFR